MSLTDELPLIPDRLSFKIGEAARLVGVEPHVLRFWEKEFSRVRPRKSRNGHRLYSKADLHLLRRVRTLLHEHRYTIAGARSLLREGETAVDTVLRGRPAEAIVRLDAAAAEVGTLREQMDEVQGDLVQARQAVHHAREEARFWQREARKAEATLEALAAAVREEAGLLREGVAPSSETL